MIDDSESQIPDFNHKPLRATSAGSSRQAPFSSSQKVADVLGSCSKSDESAKSGVPVLTLRERDIVKFIAEGNTNKETAEILGISTKTVETHRARIRLKLDLPSTPALVCYAIRNKLLDPANMAKTR